MSAAMVAVFLRLPPLELASRAAAVPATASSAVNSCGLASTVNVIFTAGLSPFGVGSGMTARVPA